MLISPERRSTLKKNPVVRLTGWEVTEDNKLHITDFDVLENLLEFPVLGSPRQLPLIDLKPSIRLKVQAEAKEKEKAKHVESEKQLAGKLVEKQAEKVAEKQLAENITKQKWEKKILHEAFILKQARSRVERRKVKILLITFLFLVNFDF